MMVNCFREVTMGAAIALREDYDAADLRRIAKGSKDAAQSRRLLSMVGISSSYSYLWRRYMPAGGARMRRGLVRPIFK